MPTIDFTSGYRDSTQGSTLKALALRRAELSAAQGARKPRRIDDPWQGAAEVADVISGGIREGRLANQEAAGRQRFAELLAGGLAPDEIGEAMGLDPETTMKYQERTWAKEDTEGERKYTEGRDLLKHGWDVDKQTAEVEARRKEAEQLATTQRTQAEQDAALSPDEAKLNQALKSGGIDQATYDSAIADLKSKRQAAGPDQWGPVTPEDAAAYGPESDVAKNPGLYHRNAKTGDVERIDQNAFANQSPASKEFDVQSSKDNQDWVATGRAQSVSNQIQLDKVLGDLDTYDKGTANPFGGGGTVGGAISGGTGIGAPSGIITSVLPDVANRFLAQGVGAPDPVNMRENVRMVAQQSLKAVLGTQFAASEGEGVMSRAYDPGATPTENARRVRLLKAKLQQVAKYNDMRAEWLSTHPTMQGFTGPSPAEIQADFLAYTNSPEFTGGGTTQAPADAQAAPADAGGGEEYQEGDVVSSPGQPDLILKGGKWVPK